MALTFGDPEPKKSGGLTFGDPVKKSGGLTFGDPVKKPATTAPSGGTGSWVEDFLFTGRLGISDTYRGVSQIAGNKGYDVPGLADPERMREDEERLNQILQDNPMAGWTGYIGGLFMDPAGWLPWTAPARRLQQINAVRNLYDKTDKASKAKRLAMEAAAAGTAGAGVGAVGYLDEDAVNPLTGEKLTRGDMATHGRRG